MTNRVHELYDSAAYDGASSMGKTRDPATGTDESQLLAAWYRERGQVIEYTLLLEEAERLISGFMTRAIVEPTLRKRAARFLRESRNAQARGADEGSA